MHLSNLKGNWQQAENYFGAGAGAEGACEILPVSPLPLGPDMVRPKFKSASRPAAEILNVLAIVVFLNQTCFNQNT